MCDDLQPMLVSDNENGTENKGELLPEFPPNGTVSPLSVSTCVATKSKNSSEDQNETVDVLSDEQSADDGKQTPNHSDPQDVDEPTVPVLTATMAEPSLNISVKDDILQKDQNGKDVLMESEVSGDQNGKDVLMESEVSGDQNGKVHSVGSEKSGGESKQTSRNLDSRTSAVHSDKRAERVTLISEVVEVNDDGLLPTMESPMVQNAWFVKSLTDFEEICTLRWS
jgi:hypothetical protein